MGLVGADSAPTEVATQVANTSKAGRWRGEITCEWCISSKFLSALTCGQYDIDRVLKSHIRDGFLGAEISAKQVVLSFERVI